MMIKITNYIVMLLAIIGIAVVFHNLNEMAAESMDYICAVIIFGSVFMLLHEDNKSCNVEYRHKKYPGVYQ